MSDSLFDPIPVVRREATGYVFCEFEGVTLAIPQSDVITIEQGSELSAALPGETALGWFASADGPWPAYALNRDLKLHSTLPDARTFLVFVRSQPLPLGLLCESIRIVRDNFSAAPLPDVMRERNGFVQHVVRLARGQLALICESGGIAEHLADQTLERAA